MIKTPNGVYCLTYVAGEYYLSSLAQIAKTQRNLDFWPYYKKRRE